MSCEQVLGCTICGEPRTGKQRWYLVLEDRWQDKVKILHWDDRLASVPGIHGACSSEHLRQLVVHWMTMGSLDHPFARAACSMESYSRKRSPRPVMEHCEGGSAPLIGELAVHRESMQRVLRESPASVQTILDALLSALRRDVPRVEPEMKSEALAFPSGGRAI
jgi:hypothetical protein